MNIHKNARLTPPGRLLLVQRVEGGGWGLAAAAMAAGISERQSYRWLARYRSGGVAALADRSSTPQCCKHRIGGGVGQAHRMAQHAYRRLPTYRTASRPSSRRPYRLSDGRSIVCLATGASLAPLIYEIFPAGPGKLLNELHIAESRQLVGAYVFEGEERRIETTDQIACTAGWVKVTVGGPLE
jgi:hypothetical protein